MERWEWESVEARFACMMQVLREITETEHEIRFLFQIPE